MPEDSKRRRTGGAKSVNLENLGLEMGNKPPQALDVEEAVLGAMLVEPNCVDEAMEELTAPCFYSEVNRLIFEAMTHLINEHVSIDIITVSQQLRKEGNLETVGGSACLARLSQQIGAAAHVEFYIKILKQKCIQRELITASYNILKNAYDDKVNVDELIDNAQSAVYNAINENIHSDVQEVGAVIGAVINDVEKLQENPGLSGVPSGFPSLDRITLGWQPSDLIIIAARPSVGKTALVLNMARNAAVDHRKPVAIFSLEMSAKQLARRMMLSETGLPSEKLKGGVKLAEHEWVQLNHQLKKLIESPIYIDETPSLPVMEFRAKAKRLVKEKGVKLIIVDYLQLMQGPVELRGLREQEVATISRTLKATAKELNVPVIALSQLSRNVAKREGSNSKPMLSDLRESGSIEQDADQVLFIYRYDYQGLSEHPEDEGKTDLIIAKNRNGAVADVHLEFRASEARFIDLEDSSLNYANKSGAPIPSAGFDASSRRIPLKDVLAGSNAGDSFGGDPFAGTSDNPFEANTEFDV
ncbi:MAG: replicative DNA helicase [Bacteroidales bacterium]|nr:replicative DNA helicase [Bacteroidales bacterium]